MLSGAPKGPLAWLLTAEDEPPARLDHVHRETTVRAALRDTFAFFADASNLERLTPPWLKFTIVTPMPLTMDRGVVIDYRISLYGVAIPWQSRIDVWEPGVRFVDRQTIGPYRWWHHEHLFESAPDGTRVVDHVQYAPRVRLISGALVRRDLERIFTYRQEVLRTIFST